MPKSCYLIQVEAFIESTNKSSEEEKTERERRKQSKPSEKKQRKEKMSWQSYVDDHLMCDVEGNHLTSAAILGQDGSVWAQSTNFPQVHSLLLRSAIFWFVIGSDDLDLLYESNFYLIR